MAPGARNKRRPFDIHGGARQPRADTTYTTGPADCNPESQEDDSVTKILKMVNEVNVVFTVTDKHGRYVKDLKKNDFKVIDDNRPAVEIRSFHNETDLPCRWGCWWTPVTRCVTVSSSSRSRQSSF